MVYEKLDSNSNLGIVAGVFIILFGVIMAGFGQSPSALYHNNAHYYKTIETKVKEKNEINETENGKEIAKYVAYTGYALLSIGSLIALTSTLIKCYIISSGWFREDNSSTSDNVNVDVESPSVSVDVNSEKESKTSGKESPYYLSQDNNNSSHFKNGGYSNKTYQKESCLSTSEEPVPDYEPPSYDQVMGESVEEN